MPKACRIAIHDRGRSRLALHPLDDGAFALVTDNWLRRLTGESVGRAGGELELPLLDDVAARLDRAYQTYESLSPSITPEWLASPMTFASGTWSATLPPWVVLRHVVNHASYHRGQVASKLGRLGFEAPATDLFFWALERSSG